MDTGDVTRRFRPKIDFLNLRGVFIWLILAVTVVPGACEDLCEHGWFYVSYGGSAKCYYISDSGRDFSNARDQCIRSDASLASIATEVESAALANLFQSKQDDERFRGNEYWIGLSRANRTAPWQWLDGSEFKWQNWDDGEPQRHDVFARAVYYNNNLQWRGTENNRNNKYGRICEKAPNNAAATPTTTTQTQTTTTTTTAAAIASTTESPTTITTRTTTQTTTTPETTTQIPDTIATAITEGSTTATSKPTTGTPTAASPTSSTARPQSTLTGTESTETSTRTTTITLTPTSHSSPASSPAVTQNTTGATSDNDGKSKDEDPIDKVLIGVVVGVVVLCVIVIVVIVFLVLKPFRRNQSQSSDEEAKPQPTENQFDGPTEESETRVAAETTEVEDETQIDAGRSNGPLYENSQFLAETKEVEDKTQIDAGGSNGPLYENTKFLPLQSNGEVEPTRDSPSPTGQEKTEDTKKTTEEEDIEALYAKPIKRAKPKN